MEENRKKYLKVAPRGFLNETYCLKAVGEEEIKEMADWDSDQQDKNPSRQSWYVSGANEYPIRFGKHNDW